MADKSPLGSGQIFGPWLGKSAKSVIKTVINWQ
jgi:hypothetical protein